MLGLLMDSPNTLVALDAGRPWLAILLKRKLAFLMKEGVGAASWLN